MSEYVPGVAKALAEVSRDAERQELPEPSEYRVGTIVRTSGGRTWKRRPATSDRPPRWREIVLIPREEALARRLRKAAVLGAAFIALIWSIAVAGPSSEAFMWGLLITGALVYVCFLLDGSEADLAAAPTERAKALLRAAPGLGLGEPPQLSSHATLPESSDGGRTSLEILTGGRADDDGHVAWVMPAVPQLPSPLEVEPGATVDVDGELWHRWGRTWVEVKHQVSAEQQRTRELVDVVLIAGGVLLVTSPLMWSGLPDPLCTTIAVVGELTVLAAVARTTLACYRAVRPKDGPDAR